MAKQRGAFQKKPLARRKGIPGLGLFLRGIALDLLVLGADELKDSPARRVHAIHRHVALDRHEDFAARFHSVALTEPQRGYRQRCHLLRFSVSADLLCLKLQRLFRAAKDDGLHDVGQHHAVVHHAAAAPRALLAKAVRKAVPAFPLCQNLHPALGLRKALQASLFGDGRKLPCVKPLKVSHRLAFLRAASTCRRACISSM